MWMSYTTYWKICLPLIVGACFLGAVTSHASPTSAEPPLYADVRLDQPLVEVGRGGSVHAHIALFAPERDRGDRLRPQMNLGLVIDRSGSMNGVHKMSYAKEAAINIVNKLRPTDRMAVVDYDDVVTLLWPSRPVLDRHGLVEAISGLSPRGSTNLAGGMMGGIRAIQPQAGMDRVSRVILLSDGLANEGITDPDRIAAMAREARASGVIVTTMGLGRDYNEDLMQQTAEAGGGRYYYVENPRALNRFFAHELEGAIQTVATGITLRITFEANVFGYDFYGPDNAAVGKTIELPIEDLYGGEDRSYVVKLDHEALAEGDAKIASISLHYRDAESGQVYDIAYPVNLSATTDRTMVADSRDAKVDAMVSMARAERLQKTVIDYAATGDSAAAEAVYEELEQELDAAYKRTGEEKLLRRKEAIVVDKQRLQDAAQSPAAMMSFSKGAKQRSYMATKGIQKGYVLQQGDKGLEVQNLQQALADAGIYAGPIDGFYDADVTAAVSAWQGQNSLSTDGVAGPQTQNSLGLY